MTNENQPAETPGDPSEGSTVAEVGQGESPITEPQPTEPESDEPTTEQPDSTDADAANDDQSAVGVMVRDHEALTNIYLRAQSDDRMSGTIGPLNRALMAWPVEWRHDESASGGA